MANNDNPTQYTDAFIIKATRHITKADFAMLFNTLNVRGYNVTPCDYDEGGLKYITEKGDKTVRFSYCYCKKHEKRTDGLLYNMPNDENINIEEWASDNTIVIPKDCKKRLFLKVRWGAPRFTWEELNHLEECFNIIDVIRVGRFPSRRKLQWTGNHRFINNLQA